MRKLLIGCATLVAGLAGVASAATINVTTTNLQGWVPGTVRTGATAGIAAVTDNLGGSGALEFYLPNGGSPSPKAEWEVYGNFGLLSELTDLSYSWYREGSSNNPGAQVPVLRLIVANAANELSYLIYEPVYNTLVPSLTEDTWHATNTNGGNFWAWKIGLGGGGSFTYTTIANYINNNYGANDIIDSTSRVVGFNMGVGSGWAGEFTGYVDHLSYGFNSAAATTYDFVASPPIPEPATMTLLGLGLAGLVARGRRKRS